MLMPQRPKDRTLKIDAAVALIMALRSVAACPLAETPKVTNPYLTRGILFIATCADLHSRSTRTLLGDRANRPCAQTGCPNVSQTKYCADHKKNNETKDYYKARQALNPFRKLYYSTAYVNWRVAMQMQNPLCQRIVNGKQCDKPSVILHHLLPPETHVHLFLRADNAVMLCRAHHPDTPGTIFWKPGVDYVPTIYRINVG